MGVRAAVGARMKSSVTWRRVSDAAGYDAGNSFKTPMGSLSNIWRRGKTTAWDQWVNAKSHLL